MEVPILAAAIILRMIASVLAFRLIPLSKGRTAWILIAGAIFLTAIRLSITLYDTLLGGGRYAYGLQEHTLALVISVLLAAGIYSIRPLFLAFHRSEENLDRARAQAELRAAEAEEGHRMLETIMEQIPAGVIIADAANLRYRIVSRHCQEMTGVASADLAGKTLEEHHQSGSMLHLDGVTMAALDELPLTRAARSGETVRGEEWLLQHADGRMLTALANADPVRNAQGKIIGGIVTWVDITERKRDDAERERLLEENRLRVAELEAIFEAAQDGIAIYGSKGEVLSMNAAILEFLGFTTEEQVMDLDTRWVLLRAVRMDGTPLPPEEIPAKRALAGEKVRTILHCQPPQRPARWFSVSSAPIRIVGAAKAVTIFTDITEIRELQQEQEIFMQMISHDLRTPITVIQGHTELLIGQLPQREEMTDLHLAGR